jgi:uncharacterized membrane protein YsdA (DUF1294 family)
MGKTEIIILIYLLVINLTAFIAMFVDKQKAKKHKWRVPEKVLFLFVVLGGGIGGTAAMSLFRHKTKHWYFKIGFPLITIVEIAASVIICIKFM